MELTREDKIRLFGMHIGCEVSVTVYYGDTPKAVKGELLGIDAFRVRVKCFDIRGNEWPDHVWYDIDRFQLKLIPLPEITDGDSIEVCKWLDYDTGNLQEMTYIGRGVVDFHFGNYIPFDDGEFDTARTRKLITNVPHGAMLNITDFLRSKGYALPYKGVDLFEAGIAIDAKTINS